MQSVPQVIAQQFFTSHPTRSLVYSDDAQCWTFGSANLVKQDFSHHINPFAVATRPTESKSKSISPSKQHACGSVSSSTQTKQNGKQPNNSEEKPALRKAPTHSNKLKAPTLQKRPLQIPTIAPLSVRPHGAIKPKRQKAVKKSQPLGCADGIKPAIRALWTCDAVLPWETNASIVILKWFSLVILPVHGMIQVTRDEWSPIKPVFQSFKRILHGWKLKVLESYAYFYTI